MMVRCVYGRSFREKDAGPEYLWYRGKDTGFGTYIPFKVLIEPNFQTSAQCSLRIGSPGNRGMHEYRIPSRLP